MKNKILNQEWITKWLLDFFLFVVLLNVFYKGTCWALFFFTTMLRLYFMFSISFIRLSKCSSICTHDSFLVPFAFFIVLLLWLCSWSLFVANVLSPNDNFVVLLLREYLVRLENWVVLFIGSFLQRMARFWDSLLLDDVLAGFSYK